MNVLVTGGYGFIGSALVRRLLRDRGARVVVVLDALTYAGRIENLEDVLGEFVDVRGDVADAARVREVFRRHRPDAVVHLAAETHVDRSILDPLAHVRTNVFGTAALLEAAREAGVSRFLHVSTDEVLGSARQTRQIGPTLILSELMQKSVVFRQYVEEMVAFKEDASIRPSSPYAASKAGGECLALAAHRTHGLPVVVARPTNCYGPRQHPEKLVPMTILRALAGERIPVYGDGLQRRDWLHVDDLCEALARLLDRGRVGEVYHVAGGSERLNLDVVRMICREAGRNPDAFIEHVADRPGHDRRYALHANKVAAECGFRPGPPIERRIEEVVRWYRENEGWWRPIVGGAEHRAWVEKNYEHRPEEVKS